MDNCSEYLNQLLVVCHQMSNEEIVIRKTCNWVTNIQLLDTFLVSVSTGLLFHNYMKKIIHML